MYFERKTNICNVLHNLIKVKTLPNSYDFLFQVPTNGLILKGWYTAITIAVFGNVAAIERVSPPPPPPPPQQPVHRIKGIQYK